MAIYDGDLYKDPWRDGYIQVFAPSPGEAPEGHVIVRLLDHRYTPIREEPWPVNKIGRAYRRIECGKRLGGRRLDTPAHGNRKR